MYRRKVLLGIGATGAVGLLGSGTVAARGGPGQRRGQACECPDGSVLAKYDFSCLEYDEEDGCLEWGFVLDHGEDVVDITVTEVKDDDPSEPISVTFEADGYVIQHVCAFGGNDTDETGDELGLTSFESDLTNPGGRQAAISNITFCGVEAEESLPHCPFYGTSRSDPTAIFSIRYDPDEGEIIELKVGDIPDESADSNYPNGIAFDDANDVWYFAEDTGALKTMNEDGAFGIEEYGVITPGGQPIAGAAFWDSTGEYLYIPNGTNQLMAADISGGETDTRHVIDLEWSNIGLGDLAIDRDEEMLYVSTTQTSESGRNFFSVDLSDPTTQQEIATEDDGDRTEFAHSSQIAFDDEGTLWAHNAGSGEWRVADLTDGSLGEVIAVTREYTDLARCGFYEAME